MKSLKKTMFHQKIKQGWKFPKENKAFMLRLALMGVAVLHTIEPTTALAANSIPIKPLASALGEIVNIFTGPIPGVATILAFTGTCLNAGFGDNQQWTTKGIKTTGFCAAATAADEVVGAMGITADSCTFF